MKKYIDYYFSVVSDIIKKRSTTTTTTTTPTPDPVTSIEGNDVIIHLEQGD
ncbi:unnamed protein product, partial [Rotaria sp. Silwood1]